MNAERVSRMGIVRKKLTEAKATAADARTISGYATVELVDMEGDIVRVAGCDIDSARSDAVPFKFFPEHTYELPDAMPAVLGKVLTVEKTTWKDGVTPAIRFTAEWATDAKGELTPIAKAYQDLYASGYLDSFSAGYQKLEGQRMGDGVDWTKTRLVEISATALAANQYSCIIKSLRKHNLYRRSFAAARSKSMSDTAPDTSTLNPGAVQGDLGTYVKRLDEVHKSLAERLDKCMTAEDVTKRFADHAATMAKSFEALHDRLDDIEGAIAVATDGPETVQKEDATKKLAKVKDDDAEFAKAFAEARASLKA